MNKVKMSASHLLTGLQHYVKKYGDMPIYIQDGMGARRAIGFQGFQEDGQWVIVIVHERPESAAQAQEYTLTDGKKVIDITDFEELKDIQDKSVN